MTLYEPLDSAAQPAARSRAQQALWFALWGGAGVAQGYVSVRCLVPFPKVLADQFVFRNFVVLKMFIAAVGSSLVCQSILRWCSPGLFDKSRTHGSHSYGLGRVLLGLSTLGVGMAVAGNGPTMIAPALGGGVKTAVWLLAGGCAAALFNGLVDLLLPKLKVEGVQISPKPIAGKEPVLLEKFVGGNYTAAAFALGVMMLAADVALEYAVDFRRDLAKYGGPLAGPWPSSFWDYPAWPPMVAGLCMGLGQLPVRAVSGAGMGGSGAFATIVATLTFDQLFPGRSLQASSKNGFSSWQLVYNFGWVLLGAFLALPATAPLLHTAEPLVDGFSPQRMFLGSFLGVLGARIAGGCTCGHGVSGTSELALDSWLGAAAIFGAAIVTRVIMVTQLGIQY